MLHPACGADINVFARVCSRIYACMPAGTRVCVQIRRKIFWSQCMHICKRINKAVAKVVMAYIVMVKRIKKDVKAEDLAAAYLYLYILIEIPACHWP